METRVTNMSRDEEIEHAVAIVEERLDILSERWKQVEQRLTQLACIRPAEYIYHSECYGPGEPMEYAALGIQKIHGKWALCHAEFEEGCEEFQWVPILQTSVVIRMRATAHIDKLYDSVLDSVSHFLPAVDNAIRHLGGVLTRS